jgi:hypothetical protein
MVLKAYTYLCIFSFLFVMSTGAVAQETAEINVDAAAEPSPEAVTKFPEQSNSAATVEEAVECAPPVGVEEAPVKADKKLESEKVPFNIGLVPYANINAYKYDPHNNFSFDILVGISGSLTGMALAGGASVVNKDVYGVQWGLVTSVVKRKLMGVQLGLVNVAGEVTKRSVQIGLVNYSDKVGNASVGLINIHKKGKHTLDVWTTDFAIINVGTKLGGDYVYSILGFSFQPRVHPDNPEDSVYWGPVIGLGGKIPIKNGGFLALEWVIHAMFDETPKIGETVSTSPNVIQQLRLVGGYEINDLLTVFAGPAININMGGTEIWGISYLPESATFAEFDPPPSQIAVGFAAGVELF